MVLLKLVDGLLASVEMTDQRGGCALVLVRHSDLDVARVAYGSQLARMLHHAYSDGMMATPSVTTSATGFFRMRFTSRRKMAKTWYIKPPRGYWSQHLRAGHARAGIPGWALRRAIRWIFYDFRWNDRNGFALFNGRSRKCRDMRRKRSAYGPSGAGGLDMERTVGKTERKDGECCHMISGIGSGDNGGMTIATPERYAQMLDAARRGGYAYPAINVTAHRP